MTTLLRPRFLAAAAMATGLFGLASAAHARSDVQFSVGVGAPAYAVPAPVYVQPQPVYVQPGYDWRQDHWRREEWRRREWEHRRWEERREWERRHHRHWDQ
jgi:hypothetical protein